LGAGRPTRPTARPSAPAYRPPTTTYRPPTTTTTTRVTTYRTPSYRNDRTHYSSAYIYIAPFYSPVIVTHAYYPTGYTAPVAAYCPPGYYPGDGATFPYGYIVASEFAAGVCPVGHKTGLNAVFPIGYQPERIAYLPNGYIGPVY
jgi:hypothetical protein